MPAAPSPEVEEFLRGPHLAALATVRPDGRPHVTAVWYEFDGRDFTIGTFRGTQKLQNVQRKGFAALSIYTCQMPYKQVIVQGAARAGSPLDSVWRERVAIRYLGAAAGKAYARDTADWDAVAIHMRPVKWTTEGFGAG